MLRVGALERMLELVASLVCVAAVGVSPKCDESVPPGVSGTAELTGPECCPTRAPWVPHRAARSRAKSPLRWPGRKRPRRLGNPTPRGPTQPPARASPSRGSRMTGLGLCGGTPRRIWIQTAEAEREPEAQSSQVALGHSGDPQRHGGPGGVPRRP